jgi:hypothetical protein
MWAKFRSWPWWGQALGWIVLPAVVFTVWVWQMHWPVWARVGLAAAAFLVWVPVMAAAAGGGGSSSPPVAEAAEAPAATTSATTTTEPTEPVEYPALAKQVQAARSKVVSFEVKFEPRRRLPADVRRALQRSERVIRDGTITADERRSALATLVVLRHAIRSGQLHQLVVEAKAEARAEARAAALAKAEAKARKKAKREAAAAAAAAEEQSEPSNCDPNYSGCLNPNSSDYDCSGGSGNGPDYTGMVQVLGDDHYGLDADSDGIGCE